jgi:predicted small secreted protein
VASRNALAGSVSSLAVISLTLTACTTLRVGSDFDHTASFAGYHSFSWMPREHYGTRNPVVIQHTREAIQAELTRKGFSYVNEAAAADFVVDCTIGAHERTDVLSYPTPYGGPWYAGGYGGWWGYPYWGNEVDVRQYREGTLAIDIFDAHTHKPVWHGWAKKELSQSDIDHSEAPIRAAVAAVLEKFPPR